MIIGIFDEIEKACGCLTENDSSGLTWYANASESGSWLNWCTPSLDPNSMCISTGESITVFNSGSGHCSHTDWHLPTMAANPTRGEAVSAVGGNWGTLGNYAGSNTGANFASWMTTNGFSGVTNGLYWSSWYYGSGNAWGVSMSIGRVGYSYTNVMNGVLLVRP